MNDVHYEHDIVVRAGDFDPMQHVNNSVYATYLEDARNHYFIDVLGKRLDELSTVLVHMNIDFQQPVEADDEVTVALRVGELGTSSIPMDYEVRTTSPTGETSVAAEAHTVQVLVDEDGSSAEPLPDSWRRRIENWPQQ